MSVRLRGVLFLAALLVSGASPLAAQKIGFVNTTRILQEMPARAQAEAQLRTALEALQMRQQVMVDSLNGLIAAFERDSAGLSQQDKVARFQTMQAYDARYRDTLEVLEQEGQQAQAEAMQPLFDQIRVALEDIRTAESYTVILDLSREGSPIVSYDRNLDISDRVLTRIRASGAPAARPPATTPAAPAQRPAPQGPVSQPTGVRRP